MPRLLPARMRLRRVPTLGELIRTAILALLVLTAMGLTQLMPGASAQDSKAGSDSADAKSNAQDDTASNAEDRSLVVTTDQAMRPDRSLSVPGISVTPTDAAASTGSQQVSGKSGRPAVPSQLTPPGQDRGQLGTQRLEGSDICDEGLPGSGPAVCARPLETRAGEFAGRAQPQLSAEQRLLAQQFSGSATGDATDGTARRLGSGRTAELSNDDLAIASVVTAAQTARQDQIQDDETDIPADATNAINAILGVINAPPPE